MSLNLNTALYYSKGVDLNNVNAVSNQILKSAQQKSAEPTVQAIDYSKFNRATLGIDLYSSRTNVDLQKQIALTQAGLYSKSVDVARLNAQAAMNLYSAQSVQKQVELTQSVAQANELTPVKQLENNRNIVQLFNISDKNSNSQNSFNPFMNGEEATTDEKSEIENLFA